MAPHGLIATITIALGAAFLGGFLATKVRLPPIVGYLAAGIAVGPFTPGLSADPQKIFEHALEARRVERHDQWCALERGRDLVERHRAHRAERLSEDHVGACVPKRTLVKVEGALTPRAGLAHEGVDLTGARVHGDRRSGHARE